MSSKKRSGSGQGTIASAFKRGKREAAEHETVPYFESDGVLNTMPETFMQEMLQRYQNYKDQQRMKAVLEPDLEGKVKTRGRALQEAEAAEEDDGPSAEDEEAAAAGGRLSRRARWERHAELCLSIVNPWAGGRMALPKTVQEMLINICLNHHLHADPELSVRAVRLLQADLTAHPPVKLLTDPGFRAHLQVFGDSKWHPLNQDRTLEKMLGHGLTALFQAMQNALNTAQAAAGTGSWSASSAAKPQPLKPGQCLVLVYLVQLLKQDALPRLQLVQQQVQELKGGGAGQGDRAGAVREKLALVLRNSLLLRLLQDYGSWADHAKGKTQFIRDCLAVIAMGPCPGGASSSTSSPADEQAVPSSSVAAAGGISRRSASPAPQWPSQGAAAAAGAAPVPLAALTSAAKQLLQLALELFSWCEELGVYSRAVGRNERDSVHENDRMKMDVVLMEALQGNKALLQLKDPAGVRRVMQALPPRHVVRLVAIMLSEAIERRPYEVAGNTKSGHVTALRDYIGAAGKGYGFFMQGDPDDVIKSVLDRYDWASRTIMSGKQLFATYMSCFICAAVAVCQQQGGDKKFAAGAVSLLESMTQKSKSSTAVIGKGENVDVVMDVALALRMAKTIV